MITDKERSVMEHATGWRTKNPGYRNHFASGPDGDDWPTLMALCERHMMRATVDAPRDLGGMTIFVVTSLGLAELREPTP